jgi:threonine synthase
VDLYNKKAGCKKIFFTEVTEQNIMDWGLRANRNGHIACTHGGETLAGLVKAKSSGIIEKGEFAVIDSTAHALKFSGFQDMYFENSFPDEYEIVPDPNLVNSPVYIHPKELKKVPATGKPLGKEDFKHFINCVSKEIATILKLN